MNRLQKKCPARFTVGASFRGVKPGGTGKKEPFKNMTSDERFAAELASVFREKLFTCARHERALVNETWWADLNADGGFKDWFKVRVFHLSASFMQVQQFK